MEIEEFNKVYFGPFLEKLSRENKITDFNIDLLKIESDDYISNYYNLLTSNLFVPHITLPTRITSHSKTLIDNIFSNDPDFSQGVSGNFTFSISDHLPQFLLMPQGIQRPPKHHNLMKRDLKNLDKEALLADVMDVNWPEVLSLDKCDPNHSFENLDNKINEIIDKHVPLKKLTKKDFKLQAKPWITAGMIKSIKRRDNLLRQYINTKDAFHKDVIHKKYKILRNKIIKLIKNSKKSYYQNYFTEKANDIRNTWIGIKNIINFRASKANQPTSMIVDKEFETDPTKIAEGFNDYFSSLAEKLQQNIYPNENISFTQYLKTPPNHNFFFNSVTAKEVVLIINLLENSKATGPYSIPTEILKLIKPNICHPLKEIINLSFATGIYPDKLKIAKVIPIFKNKGDEMLVSNYRPISLLSNVNKIFEKLAYSRLYSFLNLYNCIYELQFGFRANHSTNHALFSLTE